MKKIVIILLCIPFFVFSQTEKRLALVIGNSNYDKGELKNPVNDALLISETLKQLDFDVILDTNIADKRSFKETIREFGNRRPDYDVAFVYYAGHGIQVGSENYLLPTKEVFESEYDVQDYGVSVQDIMRYLTGMSNQVNILILDACRDNPFESNWNVTRSLKGNGLAKIPPPTGSLIAFSTDAGMTAADGDGKNSIYCESLCKNMILSNTSLDQIFRNVRTDVLDKTNGNQSPVEESKLTGDAFYLNSSKEITSIDSKEIPNISYSELISKAWDFFDNEEYDLANKYFTQAIKMSPNNPLAYYCRGFTYRAGLEFFEGVNVTDNIMDLALKDQIQALELLQEDDDDFKGDIYFEIAVIKLLIDEGGWCNAFKLSCKYNNSDACDSVEQLCK